MFKGRALVRPGAAARACACTCRTHRMAALLPRPLPSHARLHSTLVGRPPRRARALQGATDSEGKPVDAAFYRTFWGLQSYFRWALAPPLQNLVARGWAPGATLRRPSLCLHPGHAWPEALP